MFLREDTINSLWPSDAIWQHRSWSTLAQVMACCLTAPSHYLNQCWLFVSTDQWRLSKGNFTRDTQAINHENQLQFAWIKFLSNLPGANELIQWPDCPLGYKVLQDVLKPWIMWHHAYVIPSPGRWLMGCFLLDDINWLVPERRNSSTSVMELHLSCTNLSIWRAHCAMNS